MCFIFVAPINVIFMRPLYEADIQCDLRNDFHFSEVYQSVNYIGSRAKWMNPEGVHVNFASDPL